MNTPRHIARLTIPALALALAACQVGTGNQNPNVDLTTDSIAEAASIAEDAYGVPADLVLALAHVETRWQTPELHDQDEQNLEDGEAGHNHHPTTLGIGAVRPWLSTDLVAALESDLGHDRDTIHTRGPLGIVASAAVLAQLADSHPEATAGDLLSWSEVLGDYAALDDAGSRRVYADTIYQALRTGIDGTTSDGEQVVVAPRSLPYLGDDRADSRSAGQYPGSLSVPASTSNYSGGRGGQNVEFIVIHTVQGSYAGAISWFTNPAARVSAHYTVRSSDGEITQSVSEQNTAWHAGNGYYNRGSIGIEHEGYIGDPGRWYTPAMYQSSANLVRYLADKYNIPLDRQHIIGHNEVPDPSNPGGTGGAGGHTDPGSGWDWDLFMGLVRGETPQQNLPPMEVYWAREADGSYKLHALGGSDVARVEYFVDGYAIGSATRADGDNFPAFYSFSVERQERFFEARGFDSAGDQVALGVGLLDVTAGTAVFIRQLGTGYYDIGLERAPADVAYIEVDVDGFLLTDEVTGSQQSERGVVRYQFGTLGTRSMAISTFNADTSLRGTLYREFTFR